MEAQIRGLSGEAHVSVWERVAIASGLGFGVLMIGAGMSLPMPPQPDEGAVVLAEWIRDNRDALLIQSVVRGFAAVLQVVFVAALVSMLRRAEGGFNTRSLLVLAGGVTHTVLLLVANAIGATAAVLSNDSEIGPETIRALQSLGNTALLFEGMPGAMLIGVASAAIYRTNIAPRWIAWTGFLLMPVYVIGSFGFEDSPVAAIGFIAIVGEMFWFMMSSITISLRLRGKAITGRMQIAPATS